MSLAVLQLYIIDELYPKQDLQNQIAVHDWNRFIVG